MASSPSKGCWRCSAVIITLFLIVPPITSIAPQTNAQAATTTALARWEFVGATFTVNFTLTTPSQSPAYARLEAISTCTITSINPSSSGGNDVVMSEVNSVKTSTNVPTTTVATTTTQQEVTKNDLTLAGSGPAPSYCLLGISSTYLSALNSGTIPSGFDFGYNKSDLSNYNTFLNLNQRLPLPLGNLITDETGITRKPSAPIVSGAIINETLWFDQYSGILLKLIGFQFDVNPGITLVLLGTMISTNVPLRTISATGFTNTTTQITTTPSQSTSTGSQSAAATNTQTTAIGGPNIAGLPLTTALGIVAVLVIAVAAGIFALTRKRSKG